MRQQSGEERERLEAWAAELDGRPAHEILAAASARYGSRLGFATGFGAEGCVIVDLAARHGVPLDLFTLDTGQLFPETIALWRELELRYGVTIRGVRSVSAYSDADEWTVDPDACCERRKLRPLRAELARLDAWITAIRRDQTPDRAGAKVVEWDAKFGLVKVNPLAAWTAADVAAWVKAHDVPTNPLHARGYPSIGCRPCTSPVAPGEDPRAGRWRGRAKTECGLHAKPASPSNER